MTVDEAINEQIKKLSPIVQKKDIPEEFGERLKEIEEIKRELERSRAAKLVPPSSDEEKMRQGHLEDAYKYYEMNVRNRNKHHFIR